MNYWEVETIIQKKWNSVYNTYRKQFKVNWYIVTRKTLNLGLYYELKDVCRYVVEFKLELNE